MRERKEQPKAMPISHPLEFTKEKKKIKKSKMHRPLAHSLDVLLVYLLHNASVSRFYIQKRGVSKTHAIDQTFDAVPRLFVRSILFRARQRIACITMNLCCRLHCGTQQSFTKRQFNLSFTECKQMEAIVRLESLEIQINKW